MPIRPLLLLDLRRVLAAALLLGACAGRATPEPGPIAAPDAGQALLGDAEPVSEDLGTRALDSGALDAGWTPQPLDAASPRDAGTVPMDVPEDVVEPTRALIRSENLHPGTTDWMLDDPATHHEIEGFASATSVNRGDSLELHVSTREPSYTIEIFRFGWYGGAGARRMTPAYKRPGVLQPPPHRHAGTGLTECRWSDPFVLHLPAGDPAAWVSGVYAAKLTAGQTGRQSYILFVVRDDERKSDLLFQSSVATFQAYNNWGGRSAYASNSSGHHAARKVSFDRPYAEHFGLSRFMDFEYDVVRFLEREGYDVTYCTNLDTDAGGAERILAHQAFLSVGHDEYWSWDARANVTIAKEQGVNLAFLGANAMYWQVRFEASRRTRRPRRTMVIYKEVAESEDPYRLAADELRRRTTTTWRSPIVGLPEEALIGVEYIEGVWPVDADLIIAKHSWVLDNTGLGVGDRLPGLVGYEVDAAGPDSPSGILAIGHSPTHVQGAYSDLTLYTAPSGAMVFATGSMQWCWGLDDFVGQRLFEPGPRRASRKSEAAQQMMRNVLAAFVR